ncbi:acyltransferase [Sediminibacterium soli]|uniref:acyltransferase n=1 Tax=Sediminibacterium soli TaxID=2698829 RepID=UPI001379A298|nr:acyltransferase [Sediminibacterium soli]NCI45548.1 acyltransferase [Sediminibacterium soli]
MSLKEKINQNPRLKKWVHGALVRTHEARPRTWVKWFVNPFVHKKGPGAVIRRRTRTDVLPFNRFELGERSIIEDFSTVNNGSGDVIIGHHTLVGMSNVIIGPVTLGNNIILAQHVVISGLNHIYEDALRPIADQHVRTAPVVVEDDCWIAANVVITAGVTIGRHSVVAAGSVVTKNVPPFSIAAGNPARLIKQYDAEKKEWVRV